MPSRILVVEAHTDLRTVIAEALTRADYRCDAVGSANDALLKLRGSSYSTVVVDVDGPESMEQLCAAVAADPRMAGRLVLISGMPASSGSRPVLLKPFDTRELLARVRRP